MAAKIRHRDRCDHEFEVEASSQGGQGDVEGYPEQLPLDCGLATPGKRVTALREID